MGNVNFSVHRIRPIDRGSYIKKAPHDSQTSPCKGQPFRTSTTRSACLPIYSSLPCSTKALSCSKTSLLINTSPCTGQRFRTSTRNACRPIYSSLPYSTNALSCIKGSCALNNSNFNCRSSKTSKPVSQHCQVNSRPSRDASHETPNFEVPTELQVPNSRPSKDASNVTPNFEVLVQIPPFTKSGTSKDASNATPNFDVTPQVPCPDYPLQTTPPTRQTSNPPENKPHRTLTATDIARQIRSEISTEDAHSRGPIARTCPSHKSNNALSPDCSPPPASPSNPSSSKK